MLRGGGGVGGMQFLEMILYVKGVGEREFPLVIFFKTLFSFTTVRFS